MTIGDIRRAEYMDNIPLGRLIRPAGNSLDLFLHRSLDGDPADY
jgi:hypothetical protein